MYCIKLCSGREPYLGKTYYEKICRQCSVLPTEVLSRSIDRTPFGSWTKLPSILLPVYQAWEREKQEFWTLSILSSTSHSPLHASHAGWISFVIVCDVKWCYSYDVCLLYLAFLLQFANFSGQCFNASFHSSAILSKWRSWCQNNRHWILVACQMQLPFVEVDDRDVAQCSHNKFWLENRDWGLGTLEWKFGNVGFRGEEKNGVPGEKPLGAEKRTNNKLNPHTMRDVLCFVLPCCASSSPHSFLSVLSPSMTDPWARIWAVNLALS